MIEIMIFSVLCVAGSIVATTMFDDDDEAPEDEASGDTATDQDAVSGEDDGSTISNLLTDPGDAPPEKVVETITPAPSGDSADTDDMTSAPTQEDPATFPDDTADEDGAAKGSSGDDTLTGDGSDDIQRGGSGDDTLSGEAGDDRLRGGWGEDELDGGAGNDVLDGGRDNDTLLGGDGDDSLTDWHGSNTVFGGAGNDLIETGMSAGAISQVFGGDGDDMIRDLDADATLDGGDGNDTIYTGHGNSLVNGGAGDDTITDGIGTDTLYGGAGDDTIRATGTNEHGDVDAIFGGDGNDHIEFRGASQATGGDGSDTFAAYANTWVTDAPEVLDYNPDEDRLQVDIYGHEGRQALDDFDVTVADHEDGSGASVFVDGVEVMKVANAAGLSLDDLILRVV